jgi:NRPS condensation-like uncharacterized protein
LNISTAKKIDFRLLKKLSQKLKVTINDIVTSSLSMAMNTIFKQFEDPNRSIQIAIPANIRFKFYPTAQ